MQTKAQRLAQLSRQGHGYECPECGSTHTESNGGRIAYDEEFRCIECDHRWGYEAGQPYNFGDDQ